MLKHSKFKNTGILFEVLTKQVVSDVLTKKETGAKALLFKYFGAGSELNKEIDYYQKLIEVANIPNNDPLKLKKIDVVIEIRKKLDLNKLQREKYNLLGEIKRKFKLDEFLNCKISNYRLLASIYKLFEYNPSESPTEYFQNYKTILENTSSSEAREEVQINNEFKQFPKEIKDYAFNILIEKFNSKYKSILPKQKEFLKKYIEESNNSLEFRNYIYKEISELKLKIESKIKTVTNPTIKIKISEVSNLLDNLMVLKKFKDEHFSAILKYYELEQLL